MEGGVAHAFTFEARAGLAQRRFVGHLAEHQVGVGELRRNAAPARLDQGVAALHRTLGE